MGNVESNAYLTEDDLNFCKKNTRYTEEEIKSWYSSFKKDCPSGVLTKEKFADVYKLFFPHGDAENFCNHVFRTFDTDKNGEISFIEFLLAINVTLSGTPLEKLKYAFKLYDVDGNGIIDQGEMNRIVLSIYELMGEDSLSNDITEPKYTPEERTRIIFSQMDANGDGYLTEDEFVQGCEKDNELSKLLALHLLEP